MAFVSGFTVGTKSFLGARSERAVCKNARSVVKMQAEMSRSVPFLLKPKNTEGLIGSAEFDPLGFSDYIDIRFLQEAELKHGRICMLAAVGFIVQELYTFGGSYFPKMLPVDAHEYFLRTGGMTQILLFIAAFEAVSFYAIRQTLEGKREPGDFGFDPLGLGKNEAAFKRYRLSEIKNGRLAMIAVGGFIHQQWVTRMGVIEQLRNFHPLSDPMATNTGPLENLLRLKGTL
eukprot:CAMPEP_0198722294 /NCGR_PEP_ID=MMETSP1475-20131203/62_1 /TAXON_ID= ORGANISM="Unidentified sp., Strain CCMP1999" /NCGR_SAMPLE_ID=MMETSP1475 /ASSEMBLY_ACC=CAM_ASM_001111 /LENGTH=230 /DNA_ID=CAMNT_0044483197 /DNA_START=163 /DNA_END=855 /DNA_ORIENTATION=-